MECESLRSVARRWISSASSGWSLLRHLTLDLVVGSAVWRCFFDGTVELDFPLFALSVLVER